VPVEEEEEEEEEEYIKALRNNKHSKTRTYLQILGTRPDGNFGVKNKLWYIWGKMVYGSPG
jgi:hypothetical protein